MPQLASPNLPRLAALVVAAHLLGAPSAASPQGAPWPCAGWTVESGTPAYHGQHGVVVAGDLVARTERYITGTTSAFFDGTLELHRYDPERDRYVLSETVTFPEWQDLQGLDGLCVSGRTLAMQPWFLSQGGDVCHLVELDPLGPTLSTVPLHGYRLYSGRLIAAFGDTVFAVDSDGANAIRLNVIERGPSGRWAVQQVVQAVGVRIAYAPEDEVWVSAADGLVVVAASRLIPADFSAVTFERTPSGRWVQAGTLDRPAAGWFGRLGYVTGLALDGDRAALSFQRWWHSPATAWLYERDVVGAWQITQAFDGPDLTTAVALGAGRLALTRGRTTELYQRGAAGTFDLARRFHGLEGVFHLDDARVAGLTATRTAVRVVPLGAGGAGDVPVCQERGAVVCESNDPSAPRLRVFFDYTPWPHFDPRLVAGIEQAPPGALAVALRGPELGWNPAAGGALCIDGRNATRGAPALVDASGRATVAFDVSGVTLGALLGAPLFVQALVVGGSVARVTDAVRVLL